MTKLRTQAILAFSAFLIAVIGGACIFYVLFAEDYYISRKATLIDTAYDTLKTLDLSRFNYEDSSFFSSLEDDSLSVLICDEEFNEVYSSKKRDKSDLIQEVFVSNQELFSSNNTAHYYEDFTGQPVALLGKIEQEAHTYYVYMYENTRMIRRSVQYATHFLIITLLISLVLSILFTLVISGKVVKPVQEISLVAERIAENDFSVRASAKPSTYELRHLAQSVNQMADKIQRDINDLNNYNYLLLRQNRNMVEFEEVRKKITNNITHELKTPLAIISSQVEMLQYEYDDSKKEYYFSSIMEEIDKMSHLISNILHNSFSQETVQDAKMSRQDLSQLISSLAPKYEAWLISSGLHPSFSIVEGCFAMVNPMEIEQVINNYVMNARNHAQPGGQVRITLRSYEDAIYCSVYNQGEQIPESEKTRIWKGLYQIKKTSPDTGTSEIGLGLYIVNDIVTLHHGSCGVSNCSDGVEFWFRLPKAPAAPPGA